MRFIFISLSIVHGAIAAWLLGARPRMPYFKTWPRSPPFGERSHIVNGAELPPTPLRVGHPAIGLIALLCRTIDKAGPDDAVIVGTAFLVVILIQVIVVDE